MKESVIIPKNKYLKENIKKYADFTILDYEDDKIIKLKKYNIPAFTDRKINYFPFIKTVISYNELIPIFNKLQKYELQISDKIIKPKNINDKYLQNSITLCFDHDTYEFIQLIDYFQEKCRLLTRRNNQVLCPYEYFYLNKNKFEQYILKNNKKITFGAILKMFKNFRCIFSSEFDPVWLVVIIKYFRSLGYTINSILDPCAGRGSRMVASIAMNCNYLGTDPNTCTGKRYDTMRRFYSSVSFLNETDKNKWNILNVGFETDWENPNNMLYDLVFTSPPYFDLEIYSNEDSQSINKFAGLNNWLNGFMKVLMKKAASLLKSGGILCLNIDNPQHQNIDYVNPLLEFNIPELKYHGLISIHHLNKERGEPLINSVWTWIKK